MLAALKATPPAADDELIHSHYTVVGLTADARLTAEPFASYFGRPERACIAPILVGFDAWISSCKAANPHRNHNPNPNPNLNFNPNFNPNPNPNPDTNLT